MTPSASSKHRQTKTPWQALSTHIWPTFKFSVLVTLPAGTIRACLFFNADQYRLSELKFIGSQILLQHISSLFIAIPAVFILLLLFRLVFRRFEGLILAFFYTGLFFVPLIFVVNNHFLPGIRDPKSLIGNAVLLLFWLISALLFFYKFTLEQQFIRRLSGNVLFFCLLFIFAALKVGTLFQPEYKTLHASFKTDKQRDHFFNRDVLVPKKSSSDTDMSASMSEYDLLSHFSRRAIEFQDSMRARILPDSTKWVQEGDSVLSRKVIFMDRTFTWPSDLDLKNNPFQDEQWIVNFNRLAWFTALGNAWLLTGEDKYASFYADFIRQWLKQGNTPNLKNESDPMWMLFTVGMRIPFWINGMLTFFNSSFLDDKTRLEILASLHDQSNFLSYYRSPHENHLLHELLGLLTTAAQFPEFRMTSHWRDIAKERIEFCMDRDIYPDGGYKEGSTYYHYISQKLFWDLTRLAESCGLPLSDQYYQKLENMYQFLLYTSKPDSLMPQVNDGFFTRKPNYMFDYPADKFGRDDFWWFHTHGKRGRRPDSTSMWFPYTGFAVMRSDWTEDARFLFADVGLFGSAHGHEDMFNFEISAFSKPFILDMGTYTYNYDRWHRYFEHSFSHNTIVIDDRSQKRFAEPSRWFTQPSTKLPHVWISNDVFDYLQAEYSGGYGNVKEGLLKGITHTRHFLFVKPDYWLIWDVVTGDKKSELNIKQLFHMPPEPDVSGIGDLDFVVRYPNGPSLTIKTLSPSPLRRQKVVGQEDPIQGWYAPIFGTKKPSPALIYESDTILPFAIVNVLIPMRAGMEKKTLDVQAKPIRTKSGELDFSEGFALSIRSPYSEDFILLTPGISGVKDSNSLTIQETIFIKRLGSDGSVHESGVTSLDAAGTASGR